MLALVFSTGITACTSTNSTSSKTVPPEPAAMSQALDKDMAVEENLLATVKTAETLGSANPLLLSVLYSLAEFYRHQKSYDKAEAVYQRCLSLKEGTNGPHHSDIVIILGHYASLLREADRSMEASELEARAQAIREQQ